MRRRRFRTQPRDNGPRRVYADLNPDPNVDNTERLQNYVDFMAQFNNERKNGFNAELVLPFHPDGFRVDGIIHVNNLKYITIRGQNSNRRFKSYTNITGNEYYYNQQDADPTNPGNTNNNWKWVDGVVNGEYTFRWSGGSSLRAHWWIESLRSKNSTSTDNVVLKHLQVTGPNTDRIVDGYGDANWGGANPTYLSGEAEHGFQVGSQVYHPSVTNVTIEDCHAINTHGDGFTVHVDASVNNNILIKDCTGSFNGRHTVGMVAGNGVTLDNVIGVGAYSAFLDIEPNVAASDVLNFTMLNCAGSCYRTPILVQNGNAGAILQDITLDGFNFTEHGWVGVHSAFWIVKATNNTSTPIGTLTIKNFTQDATWNSTITELIDVADWPTTIVTGNVLGFASNQANSYGVSFEDTGANAQVTGNTFTNCGLGDSNLT